MSRNSQVSESGADHPLPSRGRRHLLGGLIAAGASLGPIKAFGDPSGWGPSDEEQRGDSSARYETIHVEPQKIYALLAPARATYQPRTSDFAGLIGDSALQFVGMSRATARSTISDMLALFELPFENGPNSPVPFCAAGLSFITAIAYVGFWKGDKEYWNKNKDWASVRDALHEIDRYHFYPSPSVWDMYYIALGKRRWVAKGKQPQPGWLVIYDFGKGADHVGLVLKSSESGIHTFECNTSGMVNGSQQNGGVIAVRDRDLTSVKGYIRTDLETPL